MNLSRLDDVEEADEEEEEEEEVAPKLTGVVPITVLPLPLSFTIDCLQLSRELTWKSIWLPDQVVFS